MVMSRTLPLSEVKAKLSEVVDEVVTTQERVTVTRNGRPVAVVLSTDDLEAIEETLAILSDPAAMREIQHGRAAIANGDVVTKDEIETLRSQLRAKTACTHRHTIRSLPGRPEELLIDSPTRSPSQSWTTWSAPCSQTHNGSANRYEAT